MLLKNDINKDFLVNDIVPKSKTKLAKDYRIDLFKKTDGYLLVVTDLYVDEIKDLSKSIFDLNPKCIDFSLLEIKTLYEVMNERLAFKSRAFSEYMVKNHPEIIDFAPKFDKLSAYGNMQINSRTKKILVGNGEDVLIHEFEDKVADLSGFIVGAYVNKKDLIIVHRMCVETIAVNELSQRKLKDLNLEYFNDGRRIGLYEIEKHLGFKLPSGEKK